MQNVSLILINSCGVKFDFGLFSKLDCDIVAGVIILYNFCFFPGVLFLYVTFSQNLV